MMEYRCDKFINYLAGKELGDSSLQSCNFASGPSPEPLHFRVPKYFPSTLSIMSCSSHC